MFRAASLLKVSLAALTIGLFALAPAPASAHGPHGNSYGGYGYYGNNYGHYGSGYGSGYGYQYSQPRWHDTSHWHSTPGYVWQHGNHFHYQRPQTFRHQTGHWHY